MDAAEIGDVLAERETSGKMYLEFMRTSSLSVGVYSIAAGGTDPQQPHAEDEVYYVVSGEGSITVDGEVRPVRTGSTIFVGAHQDHRFHDIAADLELLVFFAPPEGSL